LRRGKERKKGYVKYDSSQSPQRSINKKKVNRKKKKTNLYAFYAPGANWKEKKTERTQDFQGKR